MNIKTAELTGTALDWAVAKCEGKGNDCEIHAGNVLYGRVTSGFTHYNPSTDWAQGGPIIEREKIDLIACDADWEAQQNASLPMTAVEGATPLIAAMRCYVNSKLGDLMEVPDELCGSHTMPKVL